MFLDYFAIDIKFTVLYSDLLLCYLSAANINLPWLLLLILILDLNLISRWFSLGYSLPWTYILWRLSRQAGPMFGTDDVIFIKL